MRRRQLALAHILMAFVLGTYIYSPWDAVPWFDSLVKWVVFPLAAGLGVGIRYAPAVSRRLGRS